MISPATAGRRIRAWVLIAIVAAVALPRKPAAADSGRVDHRSILLSGGSMMNGDHFADVVIPAMREHFAGCRRLALVLHATHPADRDRMEARLRTAFAHIGVSDATSLHRLDEAAAVRLLESADAFFIGGGETFVLLHELARTGQLEVIRRRVEAGVKFGGVSAGANVAGLLIGTTNDFPVSDIPSRKALGLVPATINPHHPPTETKADHDARMGKIKAYLRFNPAETVLGLANASIVRWHGGRATLVAGRAWLYRRDASRELKSGIEIPELRLERPR